MTRYDYESSVIGSLLIAPEYLKEVSAIITPDDINGQSAQTIYNAMLGLSLAGKPIDAVTVKAYLAETGQPQLDYYMVECMDITPTARNALIYAELVKKESKRRKLREMAERILEDTKAEVEPDETAGMIYTELNGLNNNASKVLTSDQAVMEFYKIPKDFRCCRGITP